MTNQPTLDDVNAAVTAIEDELSRDATHMARTRELADRFADLQRGDKITINGARVHRLWTVTAAHGDGATLDDPEGRGRTFAMVATVAPRVGIFATAPDGSTVGAAVETGYFARVGDRRYIVTARRHFEGEYAGAVDVPTFYLDAADAGEAIRKARVVIGRSSGTVTTEDGRVDYRAWSDL